MLIYTQKRNAISTKVSRFRVSSETNKKDTKRCPFCLKANPNFNTNAPPFEVRGCKVFLGGAFLGQGVQI